MHVMPSYTRLYIIIDRMIGSRQPKWVVADKPSADTGVGVGSGELILGADPFWEA